MYKLTLAVSDSGKYDYFSSILYIKSLKNLETLGYECSLANRTNLSWALGCIEKVYLFTYSP